MISDPSDWGKLQEYFLANPHMLKDTWWKMAIGHEKGAVFHIINVVSWKNPACNEPEHNWSDDVDYEEAPEKHGGDIKMYEPVEWNMEIKHYPARGGEMTEFPFLEYEETPERFLSHERKILLTKNEALLEIL